MNNNAKLIIRAGGDVGIEIPIEKETITFGRDPSHEIVLDDNEVSRDHARISFEVDAFYLEDLHSTNGTFLNGKRAHKKIILQDKDLITIGERNVFEFFCEEKTSTDQGHSYASAMVEKVKQSTIPNPEISSINHGNDVEEIKAEKGDESGVMKFLTQFPTWALVLFIAIGFLILFCLIPFVVIEVTDQWCNLFSGFFNAISPGVCP